MENAIIITDYCIVSFQVKCDQYWPNRGQETYGQVQVTLLDITELATYTVRTFALVNLKVRYQNLHFNFVFF